MSRQSKHVIYIPFSFPPSVLHPPCGIHLLQRSRRISLCLLRILPFPDMSGLSASSKQQQRQQTPHVALLPSSGMGHLIPFLRLAASLSARGCAVTVVAIHPAFSSAESRQLSAFFSAMPDIRSLELHLLPFHVTTTPSTSLDPFALVFESVRRSVHLIPPLLSSATTPAPLSVLITDPTISSVVTAATAHLHLPIYVLFTSSTIMLALNAYFPTIASLIQLHTPAAAAAAAADPGSGNEERNCNSLTISPSLPPIPYSSIPHALFHPSDLFTAQFIENGRALLKVDGVLTNTFEELEGETLAVLNAGHVVRELPPVYSIGPLQPCEFENGARLAWLDAQPAASVVYVSFGSRTVLSREQRKELGNGLAGSGFGFLWAVKNKMVDREDEDEIADLVGDEFLKRVEERGLVVKEWVEQRAVLAHPAVGGFVTHCGWNSLTESIWNGIPILAWPHIGDQRMNAELMRRSGMGIWVERWGWGSEEVIGADEICGRVKELMTNVELKERAAFMKEEARKAVGAGGSSHKCLMEVLEKWKVVVG